MLRPKFVFSKESFELPLPLSPQFGLLRSWNAGTHPQTTIHEGLSSPRNIDLCPRSDEAESCLRYCSASGCVACVAPPSTPASSVLSHHSTSSTIFVCSLFVPLQRCQRSEQACRNLWDTAHDGGRGGQKESEAASRSPPGGQGRGCYNVGPQLTQMSVFMGFWALTVSDRGSPWQHTIIQQHVSDRIALVEWSSALAFFFFLIQLRL